MRVFVDMDGVLVDFDGYMKETGLTSETIKKTPHAYWKMKPMPEAIKAIHSLLGMGHDVWIATKPPTGIAYAYADKVTWVLDYIPELKRKIVITHDKSLLRGDVLIDDRPHKANVDKFQGKVIHFGSPLWPDWSEVLFWFRAGCP